MMPRKTFFSTFLSYHYFTSLHFCRENQNHVFKDKSSHFEFLAWKLDENSLIQLWARKFIFFFYFFNFVFSRFHFILFFILFSFNMIFFVIFSFEYSRQKFLKNFFFSLSIFSYLCENWWFPPLHAFFPKSNIQRPSRIPAYKITYFLRCYICIVSDILRTSRPICQLQSWIDYGCKWWSVIIIRSEDKNNTINPEIIFSSHLNCLIFFW